MDSHEFDVDERVALMEEFIAEHDISLPPMGEEMAMEIDIDYLVRASQRMSAKLKAVPEEYMDEACASAFLLNSFCRAWCQILLLPEVES